MGNIDRWKMSLENREAELDRLLEETEGYDPELWERVKELREERMEGEDS